MLYKLCFETLKKKDGLNKLLQNIDSLADESAFVSCPEYLPHVLIYDHLFGHGLSKCAPKWRSAIKKYDAELSRLKNEVFGLSENSAAPEIVKGEI